jgi:hypothetical protein
LKKKNWYVVLFTSLVHSKRIVRKLSMSILRRWPRRGTDPAGEGSWVPWELEYVCSVKNFKILEEV